jgi:tetratricopeptide (TPR) repeat protein
VTTLAALGLALNSRKLHAEAEPFLRRALASEPGNADVLAALAETEEALGDPAQAETHAARALARAPDHAAAHFVVGLLRMKQARYGDARDALLRAIAAQPDLARAHYQASLAFARLGDDASAARHVELYQQKLREMEAALRKVRMR